MKYIKLLGVLMSTALIMPLTVGCQSTTSTTDSTTQQSTANAQNTPTSSTNLPDDTSGITWTNEATITLGKTSTISGAGAKVSGSDIIISKGGNYTLTGTLTDGSITVLTEENVNLTLSDAHITNNDGPAITISNAEKAYITLASGTTNSLTDGAAYASTDEGKGALFSNDSLVIQGNGTLEATGNYKHGIACDDDLTITNGTIIATSTVKDGINVNDAIVIDGGNLQVSGASDGIDCSGTITVNDGIIIANAADDGIHAELDLTINGGDITISQSEEGIESKALLTVNGGTMNVNANDDGFNAGGGMVINDGSIYVTANADGLDSNASITINGGLVLAFGGNQPECGIDCDQSNFIITGGTVIATGGTTSTPSDTDSTQPSVVLSGPTGETLYRIEQNGSNVLTFMPPKTASTLLFSSPNLTIGEDYTIYTGGEITGEPSFYNYYADGTYSNGTENSTFSMSSMLTTIGGSTGMGGKGGMGGKNHGDGTRPNRDNFNGNPEDAAPPADAGMTPPADAGTTPPPDEGTIRPSDEGITPPTDTGMTPPVQASAPTATT